MARKARVISDNGLYHIYFKGTCNIFRSDEDYQLMISLIEQIGDGFRLLAHGFTKSDGHLFVKTGSISVFMKRILTEYAMQFNRKYNHRGAIFASRYKSEPADISYATGLARYITKNKRYHGYSQFLIGLFPSEQEFSEFMKQPEYETYGADCGVNSAKIKLTVESILNGKSFLQLTPSERAQAVRKLSQAGINHSSAAKYLGVSRGTVINSINREKAEAEKRRREEIVIL